MALNTGDTLNNNHYRIIRQLGRGGFGFVYLAQDTLLGEQVAIKELIPALVGDEAMLKRFLAEARATMRLRHKRIVATYNVFSERDYAGDTRYYIVMEYMTGGSLEERLRAQGPLSMKDAVRVAVEVCEGLACAHEEQVVHCDLKPHNILFDAMGQAKVADFGIAHISGEMLTRSWMTPAGFVAGTLPYMPPEQTDGVRDDPRIDIYALGAILHRMLTGRTYLDFDQRETPRAQADNVQRIYRQQPPPPSAHNARIPPWLDAVILKALSKRPEDRYHTADQMRAALLRGEQPAPRQVGTEPPTQLVADQQPAAPTPRLQPRVQAADRAEAQSARRAPRAPAERPVLRSRPEDKEPASARPRRDPRPGWLWPVVGAASISLIVLIVVVVTAVLPGDITETPIPGPTLTAAAELTAVAAVPPTNTPTPTDTPTRTDTPSPTPTGTPTVTPTITPTPGAGSTQTRSKDGMIMVYVPAGEFLMGSNEGDNDEKPVHTVSLDGFWIDSTEVTNAQFRSCVEAGACQAPTTCDFGSPTYEDGSKADHPVVCVDWDQASAYCEWAGARLPTEAEWEKAARGTDGLTYPWGNQDPDCDRANYGGPDGCVGDTSPVDSYPSGDSPYGALNMAGNVWEWVTDWYDAEYYASSPANNPQGPDSGERRVPRGGSWGDNLHTVRAANRSSVDPMDRSHNVGFRCAVSRED